MQLIKEILKLSELHFVSVHDRGVGGIITAIDKLVRLPRNSSRVAMARDVAAKLLQIAYEIVRDK